MGFVVSAGDIPTWLQATVEATALYCAVRGRRQAQALDWARTLSELSGLEGEELRRRVEDNPVVAEIVGLAWEKAAETASEDKRRLLGKVVVAALRGDAAADVEPLQFLLRTVMALEPAHVTLLVVIATPNEPVERETDEATEVWVTEEEINNRWHNSADLLDPAVAVLEREGLIHVRTDRGGSRDWMLRPYGTRFFEFLEVEGEVGCFRDRIPVIPGQTTIFDVLGD